MEYFIPIGVYFVDNVKNIYQFGYNMKNEERSKLVGFVKGSRKKLGLTQVDLSQKSGVGLRFVRDMEQGKESLRMDKVAQVLSILGAELVPQKIERSINEVR